MKCPICGEEDTLQVSFLNQYSRNYKINKNGCLSKKFTKSDDLSMEVSILICENGCDVNDYDWDWDLTTRKLTIEETRRWELR